MYYEKLSARKIKREVVRVKATGPKIFEIERILALDKMMP